MSYVGSPFTQDLFVTYSHGTGVDGKAHLREWSVAFAKELESELRFERPYRDNLRLFIDNDLRPGQGVDPMAPLTEQLRGQIGDSALLVVLMSPDYIASQWCRQERDWWQQRQTELGISWDTRIAVVRAMPTNDPWPDLFKDSAGQPLVGFLFHSDASGLKRPLGYTDPTGTFGTEFKKALLDVVGHIYLALDKTRKSLEEHHLAQDDLTKLAQDGGQTIYLHSRADHQAAWEKAAATLGEAGFAVLPGEPEKLDPDPKQQQVLRAQRIETMSDCDALLLVAKEGRALDADLVTVGKHDRQSARARSNRLLPCGVLNVEGESVATAIRRRTARNLLIDWLDATQPDWTASVAQWLKNKSGL